MAITLTIFDNFTKKRNSTLRPSNGYTRQVVLKENSSLSSPYFIIDGVDLNANYCQWEGRYYFIDDIVLQHASIYELHCSIDVLATFKTEIGSYTAFVERASVNYDTLVDDTLLSNKRDVVNADSAYTDLGFSSSGGCYIFSGVNFGGLFWVCTQNLGVLSTMFSNLAYGGYSFANLPANAYLDITDPASHMGNAMWVPFNMSDIAGNALSQITFGHVNYTVTPNTLFELTRDRYYPASIKLNLPANYYNDFRALNDSFSNYTLLLPGVGTVPLPAIETADDDLYLEYGFDFYTGSVNYLITQGTGMGYKILGQYNGQLGLSLPIAQAGNNNSQNLISTIAGGVTSAVSIEGAELGAVGDVLSIGNVLGSEIAAVQSTFGGNMSINGGSGNRAFIMAHNVARVTLENYASKEFPQNVAGRPVFENKQINTFSGYVKCGGASVPIAGFPQWKAEVNAHLNSGFYYE